jgi:hypothetical protein
VSQALRLGWNELVMDDQQGCEWLRLYRRIKTLLKQHGKPDYEGGLEIADFLLVQDNWGGPLHQVEIHSLHLLQPAIVTSLQGLLVEFPEWEIVVRVDVPGKEDAWPGTGLTIYADSICDALKREYLPVEYRDLAYEGAVPFESPDSKS